MEQTIYEEYQEQAKLKMGIDVVQIYSPMINLMLSIIEKRFKELEQKCSQCKKGTEKWD